MAPPDHPGGAPVSTASPTATLSPLEAELLALASHAPAEAITRALEDEDALAADHRGLILAVETWYRRAPDQLIRFAESYPPGANQQRLAEAIALVVATASPDAGIAWLDALPSTRFKDLSARAIGSLLALDHPDAARRWAAALPPNQSYPQSAIQGVAEALALTAPAETARWSLSLEARHLIPSAVAGVLASWAAIDPESAADWLASLPHAILNDPQIAAYIHGARTTDPDAAQAALAAIRSPDTRRQLALDLAAIRLARGQAPAPATPPAAAVRAEGDPAAGVPTGHP
ncbi:MAG: hypothetical protein D6781_04445 [Verrucomicrobia bacterium]|nr:MAG: hypothetical protein D6781_04445 [Verrucomicrobiota bacterium]